MTTTTRSTMAELGICERLGPIVDELFQEFLNKELKEAEALFPHYCPLDLAGVARPAAGRALDRGLLLIARRVKGEA